MITTFKRKFPYGRMVMTRGVAEEIHEMEILDAIRRHLSGDWGDVNQNDTRMNEIALRDGYRLFSVYHTRAGKKFYIITEADRSATTVLLPEEY